MDFTFVYLFKEVQNSRKLESPEVGMFPAEVKPSDTGLLVSVLML